MICISPKAVLDDNQKQVLFNIQPHTVGHTIYVTRGHSSPLDQLRNIENYAKETGCLFAEFVHGDLHSKVEVWIDGVKKTVFSWQQSWSMLLHLYSTSGGKRGAKINPPFAAECLFDYIADGRNKKGETIATSPHIKELTDPAPCPIDFSQRIDGTVVKGEMVGGTPDLFAVTAIMEKAKADDAGIRKIVAEIANGCCHIDTLKVTQNG